MSISHLPPPSPTFYDVREVAAMFKMSRMTVYRAISSGELRAVRVRGRWLVPAQVIASLVESAVAGDGTAPAQPPFGTAGGA